MTESTPTSKQILTSILLPLNQIIPTEPSTSSTPSATQPPPNLPSNPTSLLSTLTDPHSQTLKKTLQTLHFLFPHELLPALDLIDRNLITHLSYAPSLADPAPATTTADSEIYLVQSATRGGSGSNKVSKSRFRNALKELVYEVRLDAWNCSCPAFAYSWLKLSGRGRVHGSDQIRERDQIQGDGEGEEQERWEWLVGGTATRENAVVPICKHILAVVLIKAAPGVFGGGVVRREVDKEEMAGWAAGWGEH